MNTIPNALIRTTFFICSCIVAGDAFGQFQFGAIAGASCNMPIHENDQGTQSPDLYGNAIGGYAGARFQYGLTKRFSVASELSYQILPYTNKFVTGQFYPGYITLSVLPSYALLPKVNLEGGIGTGITVVSRFEDKKNNDPLVLGSLGLRIPLGNWGISLRYYRFLRPLYQQVTGRNESTFSSQGIQIGAIYELLRR